jgi:hypothetical protein
MRGSAGQPSPHVFQFLRAQLELAAHLREGERRVPQRAGHPHLVAGARARAQQRLPGGHFAEDLHADIERPAGGVAADEIDVERIGQLEEPAHESADPDLAAFGMASDSVTQRARAPIAARSDKFTAKAFQPTP